MSDEKKIRPQDRWDAKAGVKTRGYKLHTALADEFRDTCRRVGISQARAMEQLMQGFIDEHKEEHKE